MKTRTPIRVGVLVAAMVTPALALAAPAGTAPLDSARVGWSEIRMTASKLFMSAEAQLALRMRPAPSVSSELVTFPGDQGVQPGAEVLELVYDARGAGRQSRISLYMDPLTGAALQETSHDLGGKLRYRIYRYGDTGAYQRTRWPATDEEKKLAPARWTRTSEGLREFSEPALRQPVVDSTGLLYVASAAALDRPGDTLDVRVFQRRDTQLVRIEVLKPGEVDVRYDELWPKGTVQRQARITPLRLALQAVARPGQPADEGVEVLGLQGRLELLLEPESRAPLQLSGNVKVLGQITLRLVAMRPR